MSRGYRNPPKHVKLMTMENDGLGIAGLADLQELRRDARGVTFAARDIKLDRRVALRAFRVLPTAEQRDRFRHEATVLGRLSGHPNVVTVYDAGVTEQGVPYLVTELVNGPTLAETISLPSARSWQESVDLCLQLVGVLEQGHRAGVLHRDLRPESIAMAGPSPKIDGFAINVIEESTPAGSRSNSGDPTPHLHRAPETYTATWDERSDLYSLASILYLLIEGQAPMWRPSPDSSEALAHRIANQSPVDLSADAVPAGLNVFVMAALAKDPLDRPQTATEFAGELRLVREGRVSGATPSVLHTATFSGLVPPPVPSPPGPPVGAPPLVSTDQTAIIDPAATAPPLTAVGATTTPPAPTFAPAASVGAAIDPVGLADPIGHNQDATRVAVLPPTGTGPDYPPPSGSVAAMDDLTTVSPANSLLNETPAQNLTLPPPVQEAPRRSAMFLASLALLAVTVVGFVAVLVFSAIGSDGDSAAPALPDPDALVELQAGAEGVVQPGDSQTGTLEATTSTTEDPTSTTVVATEVEVPDLLGLSVDQATSALAEAGLGSLVSSRRASNAPPGTVIEQVPAPGTVVTPPLSVTLFIPEAASLPAMVGRPADAVCAELAALGLTCNRTEQNNDQVSVGSVIATNPVEGSLFSGTTSVDVTVSIGPVVDITVPDVAGGTRAEAEAALEAAGFSSIAFAVRDSSAPRNQVFGTDPAAGTILPSNRPITILLSTGEAEPVAVPDTVALSQADATALIEAANLVVAIVTVDLPAGDEQIGRVISSDPVAGTEVDPGSTVTIQVGQEEPAPEPTTTTVPEEESTDDTTDTTMPEDESTDDTTDTTMPEEESTDDTTETTAAP